MESLDDELPELFPPDANQHSLNFNNLLEGMDCNRPF